MNNLPTRPGLNDDHGAAINTLLFSYDSRETDEIKRGKVAIYKEAVAELPQWAVEEAVKNFISGKVERKTDYRPTTEALAKEARRVLDEEKTRQDMEETRRRLAGMRGEATPARHGMSPYEKRKERIEAEMQGRPIMARSIDYMTMRRTMRDYPSGSVWVAATGHVYAPENENG